jgi:hypothetical protein
MTDLDPVILYGLLRYQHDLAEADEEQLAHLLAHAETLPQSPVADAMRHLADEEAEYRRARQRDLELAGGAA